MTAVGSYENYRHLGRIITGVSVITFLVVLGFSLVYGPGIGGRYALSAISWALIGVAIVFIGGFAFEIYGSVRIWLSRRRAAPQATARRRTERT
nr:hypothetical protein [Candidatus Freyarchaeota archaeon]